MEDLDLLDAGEDIVETVARNQELETLTIAIQSLPKSCRRIFTLCKVYGMTPKEIAAELGLSLPSVYTQLAIGVDKRSVGLPLSWRSYFWELPILKKRAQLDWLKALLPRLMNDTSWKTDRS